MFYYFFHCYRGNGRKKNKDRDTYCLCEYIHFFSEFILAVKHKSATKQGGLPPQHWKVNQRWVNTISNEFWYWQSYVFIIAHWHNSCQAPGWREAIVLTGMRVHTLICTSHILWGVEVIREYNWTFQIEGNIGNTLDYVAVHMSKGGTKTKNNAGMHVEFIMN